MKRRLSACRNRLVCALPFLLMYFILLGLGMKIRFFVWSMVLPNILFSALWIAAIVFFAENFGKVGKVFYAVLFVLAFLLFFTNCVYFFLTGCFFSFHLLQMANEGSSYIVDTLVHTPPVVYAAGGLVIASGVAGFLRLESNENRSLRKTVLCAALFVLAHACIPLLYGKENKSLKWNNFQNARNIYSDFYDKNKAVKVCGFYEYSARDFYLSYLKKDDKESPEERKFLSEEYSRKTVHAKNDQTGVYAGKNIIFLQLEGIDTWLLTEETMPNLYRLVSQSKDFANHYSYYNGGGSTFNSELAVNTGFITPVTFTRNAYTFSDNAFPYSLPNVLKEQGYQVNAFHMNTGEFYSRRTNYMNWGYDRYYSLLDDGDYQDKSYELDRELIRNKTFYDVIFNKNQPFMDYIITYTPHKPFDGSNETAQLLLKETYGSDVSELTEEEYARLLAGETDQMIGLLMEGLRDNGLLDNTIIVGFTDHYMYTLSDKTILDKYKETDSNLINQTPFFIWSAGEPYQKITKVNAQIDILPTVLNMIGAAYTDSDYIGQDIFSPDYKGYVFFSDGSMYDGVNYSEDANLPQIQKNDLTLKYDYFRDCPEEQQE